MKQEAQLTKGKSITLLVILSLGFVMAVLDTPGFGRSGN